MLDCGALDCAALVAGIGGGTDALAATGGGVGSTLTNTARLAIGAFSAMIGGGVTGVIGATGAVVADCAPGTGTLVAGPGVKGFVGADCAGILSFALN